MTLAVLPRHSETIPSLAAVRLKHSAIPSYLRSRRPVFNISSYRSANISIDASSTLPFVFDEDRLT